jgi:hypothetical protein
MITRFAQFKYSSITTTHVYSPPSKTSSMNAALCPCLESPTSWFLRCMFGGAGPGVFSRKYPEHSLLFALPQFHPLFARSCLVLSRPPAVSSSLTAHFILIHIVFHGALVLSPFIAITPLHIDWWPAPLWDKSSIVNYKFHPVPFLAHCKFECIRCNRNMCMNKRKWLQRCPSVHLLTPLWGSTDVIHFNAIHAASASDGTKMSYSSLCALTNQHQDHECYTVSSNRSHGQS